MNTCNTCACNGVCDHNVNGFETCGNWIPKWISVEEKRPAYREKVLFITKAGEVSFAKGSIDWEDGSVSFWDVKTDLWVKGTHWMPLPEPPKEEE